MTKLGITHDDDDDVRTADGKPAEVDSEPAKRNLESALRSLDNMQQLVNRLAGRKGSAAAINIGMSADGFFTIYVTANDRLDERKIGAAAMELFSGAIFDSGRAEHRAAMVRLVVAQQWAVAISFWWNEARGLGLDVDEPGHRWAGDDYALAAATAAKNMRVTTMVRHFARAPCAADVVAELLGETR